MKVEESLSALGEDPLLPAFTHWRESLFYRYAYMYTLGRKEWRKLPSAKVAECQLNITNNFANQTYQQNWSQVTVSWRYALNYYYNVPDS